jgi:hypothetical protein
LEKRTKTLAGVGTDRHKQAVRNIASHVRIFPPSESRIVCMAVLYMEDSLTSGAVTIEDLFSKFHQPFFG